MRAVLVTGATGFIGRHVVRALVGRGHSVRALARDPARLAPLRGLPLEAALGDLADPASLAAAARGCAACIHLAGPSAWHAQDRAVVEQSIVGGTERLLAALEAAAVGRLVHVSSAAALGGSRRPEVRDEESADRPLGPRLVYGRAKRAAERRVLARNGPALAALSVLPVETYGPEDFDRVTAGSLRDALRGRPGLAVPGGTAIAHVADVAAGIVAALERGRAGERYILGGQNLTYAELVGMTRALAGRPSRVVTVPYAALRAVVALARASRLPPPVEPGLLPYLRWHWFFDCTKAMAELGYAPRPARATLEPTVAWLLRQAPDETQETVADAKPIAPARRPSLG